MNLDDVFREEHRGPYKKHEVHEALARGDIAARQRIIRLFRENAGDLSATARRMQVNRVSLWKWAKKFGLVEDLERIRNEIERTYGVRTRKRGYGTRRPR